ncbi:hypothetical protein TWF694_010256 [Orbilia ellipsospora]|uniref:BTB domain-containing protein n=1 Tax=Orbilia ellipsospora TaxID=2528407 RepID=A0AAV9X9D2_9PEZI
MSFHRPANEVAGAGLSILLRNNKYSDLKLIVGPQEQEFLAHKNIVCTLSDYIDKKCMKNTQIQTPSRPTAKLKSNQQDQITEIRLPTIQNPETIELILGFMYGQSYDLLKKSTQANISIFVTADFLGIPELKRYMIHEYTRIFKEKQGRWAHTDIVLIIETIIRKEFTRSYDELGEHPDTAQFQVETMEMLSELINFVELRDLIYVPEFQQMLEDGTVAKVVAVAVIKRRWICNTCSSERQIGSNTKVSCSKCGEVLRLSEGLAKSTSDKE